MRCPYCKKKVGLVGTELLNTEDLVSPKPDLFKIPEPISEKDLEKTVKILIDNARGKKMTKQQRFSAARRAGKK